MPEIVVRPVSTRREQTAFLGFPWMLYRGDPNWVPPLRGQQREIVGFGQHPFYHRNRAQAFLVYRGGELCGRIVAILNVGHIQRYNDPRGFFGFFECRDDQKAADALFDACRSWFATRGIVKLRGPMNPCLNYTLGMLVDGFDSPPTFMMTYNPPYYERLLENHGFRKVQDLYAFRAHISMLPERAERLKPVCDRITNRFNAHLRPLDTSRFDEDVSTFLSLYNRALADTWGFVPMSDAEMAHMAKELRHFIVPELAIAVEVDGQVLGATFGLLDYNPRIRLINGRLFPFGWIRLLHNRRAIKRIRVICTNVLPEYQWRGLGLVMLQGILPKAFEWGIEEAEFSWVFESNSLSRGVQANGLKIAKTYRLYDLPSRVDEGRPC